MWPNTSSLISSIQRTLFEKSRGSFRQNLANHSCGILNPVHHKFYLKAVCEKRKRSKLFLKVEWTEPRLGALEKKLSSLTFSTSRTWQVMMFNFNGFWLLDFVTGKMSEIFSIMISLSLFLYRFCRGCFPDKTSPAAHMFLSIHTLRSHSCVYAWKHVWLMDIPGIVSSSHRSSVLLDPHPSPFLHLLIQEPWEPYSCQGFC